MPHIKLRPIPFAGKVTNSGGFDTQVIAATEVWTRGESLVKQLASIGDGIRQACDLFQDDWNRGVAPRIEEYLTWVAPAHRPELFKRLVRMELQTRSARQGGVGIADYLRRFPEFSQILREIWPQSPGDGGVPTQRVHSVILVVRPPRGKISAFELRAGSVVRIGRGRDVHVRLVGDKSVSRRHLQLDIRASEVRVRDLGSRNGVKRETHRIKSAVIRHGDVLRIGLTKLQVCIRYEN